MHPTKQPNHRRISCKPYPEKSIKPKNHSISYMKAKSDYKKDTQKDLINENTGEKQFSSYNKPR